MKNGWIKKIIGQKEVVPKPIDTIGFCVTTIRPGSHYSIESIILKIPLAYRSKQGLYLKEDDYQLHDTYESALAWAEDLCYSKYFENHEPANLYFDGKQIEVAQRYITHVAQRKDTSNQAPIAGAGGGWGAAGGFTQDEIDIQEANNALATQKNSGLGA